MMAYPAPSEPATTFDLSLRRRHRSAAEGLVRVCVPIYVVSLQILAVHVSFEKSFSLGAGVATSTSSYVLFCSLLYFSIPLDCW